MEFSYTHTFFLYRVTNDILLMCPLKTCQIGTGRLLGPPVLLLASKQLANTLDTALPEVLSNTPGKCDTRKSKDSHTETPLMTPHGLADHVSYGFLGLDLAGWPRLKWVVTDSKYLTKPSKDWQPHIPTANTEPAYIEVTITPTIPCLPHYQPITLGVPVCISVSHLIAVVSPPQYKASKEGTVMGVAVSKVAMLTHCQALTQACNYCEGELHNIYWGVVFGVGGVQTFIRYAICYF